MADVLAHQGQEALLRGEFEKAQWALNASLYLNRSSSPIKNPSLWQRGLSSYYACHFKEGQLQLECDMSTNGSDVEEVIWHFLCCCSISGFHGASLGGLITLNDASSYLPVPPMLQVLELFKGNGSPEAVLMSATSTRKSGREQDSSPVIVKSYNNTNALAYAHFYIGLYNEVLGEYKTAKHHLLAAAELKNPDFMGGIMQMHFNLFCHRYPPGFYSTICPVRGVPPKIIHGGWQTSEGHLIQRAQDCNIVESVKDLLQVVDAGIRAFDCGDIYVGVEEVYGQLIKAYCSRGGKRDDILIHTKLVPDLTAIQNHAVDKHYIESVVQRTLNRLGVKSVDLVQFCWWDTSISGYIEALNSLIDLAKQGLVKRIGTTNFDTEMTKSLLDAGIPIASTQVQYSLIDKRPMKSGLVKLCAENHINILAYGVLAGGFLTDSWLGKRQPKVEDLPNRSLIKYLLIIEEFGGWGLFQKLLQTLREVADRYGSVSTPDNKAKLEVSIAMVAISYVLKQEQVSSVIIGAHSCKYMESTLSAATLELSVADMADIEAVLKCSEGPGGHVYGLERERKSLHGAIMRYNLNQVNGAPHLEELCRRYLHLHFEGHPVEATRTGYRFPTPAGLHLEFPKTFSVNSDKKVFDFDFDKTSLASMRALSFDHLLGPCSESDIQGYCEKVESLLKEVLSIDAAVLSPDQLVDLTLITSNLKLELLEWREIQMYKKDPLFYLPLNSILYLLPAWGPEDLISGGESLKNHPGAMSMSKSERLCALLSRLRAMPNALIQAHRNLTKPVRPFVETALEICESFSYFLANSIPALCRTIVPTQGQKYVPLLSEINAATAVAADCIKKYMSFLQDHLLPMSSSSVGMGKELYEKVLQYSHFIGSSPELLALGETHFSEVKGRLNSLAAEIDPTKSWKEITEDVIHHMHPTSNNLLKSYMSEIERCRDHMISCDLVSLLPEDEMIVGFSTPQFLTPFSPLGDYLNPSPFAGMGHDSKEATSRTGHLMLHSIKDMNLPKDEEQKLLRGHDYTWITVVCPHESYPGHHIQALCAQKHPRILRKYHESTLFYEGWGLYTEQLAYETGFFEKDLTYQVEGSTTEKAVSAEEFARLTRLTQLRLQLWRAARIILDVKLNMGELTVQECSEFLQREVMFNPGATKGEVFMYMSRPGYAPCYIAGFVMIMKLREEMKERKGSSFKLKDFHDQLLSKGCIPFKLLSTLLN